MRSSQSVGFGCRLIRIPRSIVIFALAMAMGVAWNLAAPQSLPAAAADPPAQDLYKAVYNGWKWWHVYCYRCH